MVQRSTLSAIRPIFTLLVALLLSSSTLLSGQSNSQPPISAFEEMRLGIFIHWGVYSMLGQGEWVMHNKDINYQEYAKLPSAFYPASFDARKWVSQIKASGAKYICFTTRHHDGFSMFDTKYSDYNIVKATPFGRDVLKELSQACAEEGIKLHLYYSLIDWYRDDYRPIGRTGHGTGRPGLGKYEDYLDFMCGQLTELLTNYGNIGCVWFDGHWDQDENPNNFDWGYDRLYSLIKELQPDCLIGNNHHLSPFPGEDIQIFERDVPGENTAGYYAGSVSHLPLETCQTMNGSWGYKITDRDYKSTPQLIKYLVSTAGRNANLLLNVGPQPNGEIPDEAVLRLKEMGEWLSINGETIFGTRGDLLPPQKWGVLTHKGDRIFVHIFPEDATSLQELFLPLKGLKVRSVKRYDTGEELSFKREKEGIRITLGAIPQESPDWILVIQGPIRNQ